MSEKFTKGPWAISGVSLNTGSVSIKHAEHRIIIAEVTNAASLGDFVSAAVRGRLDFGAPDTAVTQWANARLIVAAPELFEALAALVKHDEQFWNENKVPELVAAHAALSKARGETE